MRVSITTLEAFRRYMSGVCWCPDFCRCQDDLVASIRREFKPSARMEAGSRFHEAIETYDFTGFDRQSVVDSLILADYGRIAQPLADHLGIREGKFTSSMLGVLVVGKFDYLHHGTVYDWKTTEGSGGADYFDSLQWRLTLAALPEITRFRYETFQLKTVEPRSVDQGDGHSDPPVTVVRYLPPGQEFVRYPLMRADCEEWVRRFVDFIKLRGLDEFVTDRPSTEFPEVSA